MGYFKLWCPGPDLIMDYKQLLYIVNLNIHNTYTVKSTAIFYFHDPKTPALKPQFSDTPTPPRGYPPFLSEGTPLFPSITNTDE